MQPGRGMISLLRVPITLINQLYQSLNLKKYVEIFNGQISKRIYTVLFETVFGPLGAIQILPNPGFNSNFEGVLNFFKTRPLGNQK